MIRRLFLALAAAPLLLAGCAAPRNAGRPQAEAGALPASALVSAADPRAAEAGARMLRAGGSAADAAVATMLALTVVEPQSSGIGGGGFFVRATPKGDVATIDGRETAPATATPDWFLDHEGKPLPFRMAVESGLSVGVPGNIALAWEAHVRFGKLPWARLFDPAIALAEDGWRVSERFRRFLDTSRSTGAHDPAARALFYDAAGEPLPVGSLVRNPQLAATLRDIARSGPSAFYEGARAAALAETVARAWPQADAMTAADITAYRARERPPVCGTYRLYRVCGMGPPSSGGTTVLAILGQLEHFDLNALGPQSPEFWHLFAESQRLAYADRERFLADADFVAVPVARLVEPAYLARRGALIRPDGTMQAAEPGLPLPPPDGAEPPENGTSHFVAIDRDGNAVSYTSTIESAFGSGLMTGGFYLNNELTDFSFVPEKDGRPVANRVEGGKRPRSSMAPTVIYAPDGGLWMAVGAAGGGTIPVQVAKTIIAAIDFGQSPTEAIALPVLFSPGDTVYIERGSALEAMVPALVARGHAKVEVRDLPLKTNAAMRGAGGWTGAADPRSEGASVNE